jgi:hypothetical protein
MRGRRLLLTAVLVLVAVPLHAAEPAPLIKARGLYNARDYSGAIEAAGEARRQPDWADTAAVVQGRAFLERYRQGTDPADLAAGREAFQSVRSQKLAPRDYVDLLVGMGQYLYLAETFGPAAELFDTALAQSFLLTDGERLTLLDWWANALERSAQARPADRRVPVFERLITRMEDEIRRDAANPVANYWLAVAARGSGDTDRAWDAAIAGWVRSSLSPDSAPKVRQDLDSFVTKVLVPERMRTRGSRESQETSKAMLEEWEQLKKQWK